MLFKEFAIYTDVVYITLIFGVSAINKQNKTKGDCRVSIDIGAKNITGVPLSYIGRKFNFSECVA